MHDKGDTMTTLDSAPAPKRLTLSHIVEMLLSRGAQERSSVTLSRNAKGDTLIDVTVRTGEASGIDSVTDAEQAAREVYNRLRAEYPPSSVLYAGSGVILTRNAKGETQISVEVKAGDGHAARTLDEVEADALVTYQRMTRRYPLAGAVAVAQPTEDAA